MGTLALVAGADPLTAGRLAVSMTALQAAIGALNDLVDRARDAGRADKPLAVGTLSPRTAGVVVAGAAVLGIALVSPSGWPAVALALAVLAVGFAYDLRAKGTAWSWLPFAVGIPLLPVFAWAGAGQPLPPSFGVLLPVAVAAGAGLAIGNALADLDRDRRSGVDSVAVRLGPLRAWLVHAALLGGVVFVAVVTALEAGEGSASSGLALLGGATVLAGVALAGRRDRAVAERAWELEAVGVALLAVGWVVATAR